MLLGKKTQDVWILIEIIFPGAPTHKSHRISSLLTRILLHIADRIYRQHKRWQQVVFCKLRLHFHLSLLLKLCLLP